MTLKGFELESQYYSRKNNEKKLNKVNAAESNKKKCFKHFTAF
jgi:hypothetical protein